MHLNRAKNSDGQPKNFKQTHSEKFKYSPHYMENYHKKSLHHH